MHFAKQNEEQNKLEPKIQLSTIDLSILLKFGMTHV